MEQALPVLIEPVVDLGLSVDGVAEVGGARRGNPELVLIHAEDVVDELLVFALVVLLDNAKVSGGTYRESVRTKPTSESNGLSKLAVDKSLGDQHL